MHSVIQAQPEATITPEQYTIGFTGITTIKIDAKGRLLIPRTNLQFNNTEIPDFFSLVPFALKNTDVLYFFPEHLLTTDFAQSGIDRYATLHRPDALRRVVLPRLARTPFERQEVFLCGHGPYFSLSLHKNAPEIPNEILHALLHPLLREKIVPPSANGDALPAVSTTVLERILENLGLTQGPHTISLPIGGTQIAVRLDVHITVSVLDPTQLPVRE